MLHMMCKVSVLVASCHTVLRGKLDIRGIRCEILCWYGYVMQMDRGQLHKERVGF